MPLNPLRNTILSYIHWAVANEPSIHYAQATDPQVRPMHLKQFKAKQLPIKMDCSDFTTSLYYAANAKDPNRLNYNGQGYTGTLLAASDHVPISDLRPGDFAIFMHPFGATTHVSVVVTPGADPLLVSHGMEAGPLLIRLSAEKAYHTGEVVVGCRTIYDPLTRPHKPTPPDMWRVTAGDGAVLARHVKHPALWAAAHAGLFRVRGVVRFDQEN